MCILLPASLPPGVFVELSVVTLAIGRGTGTCLRQGHFCIACLQQRESANKKQANVTTLFTFPSFRVEVKT